MQEPLLSICMCLRNDNYGGDQEERFKTFINYYSKIQKKYEGYFEFVICDYNSPSKKYVHQMKIPWMALSPIKFVVVTQEQNKKKFLGKGRPILDYVGRNVAVRHARAKNILILNQDIFVSESIFNFIIKKKLDSKYFYRADRWDVPFDIIRKSSPEHLMSEAEKHLIKVHRRHDARYNDISIFCSPFDSYKVCSKIQDGEELDILNSIIYRNTSHNAQKPLCKQSWEFEKIGLHTNACGDFIITPKEAWEKIHGAYEATEFYIHLDSYLICQLSGAGYQQAIFQLPHRIIHADHDRSGRLNFKETITYGEHRVRLAKIALGLEAPQLNNEKWGFADQHLQSYQF